MFKLLVLKSRPVQILAMIETLRKKLKKKRKRFIKTIKYMKKVQ